jgi:hypothetical protein
MQINNYYIYCCIVATPDDGSNAETCRVCTLVILSDE